MPIRIFSIFFICVLYLPTVLWAQDSLIYKNGRRIAYLSINQYSDGVEIKTTDKDWLTIPHDSILGLSEAVKEKAFFCKPNPDPEEPGEYLMLERMEVGKISLYEDNKGGYSAYVEKDGRFEKIFSPAETKSQEENRIEIFRSFVEDDSESISYMDAKDFKYKFKEIQKVVQYYNQRNYVEIDPAAYPVRGAIFLYRTQFQRTEEGIKVRLFGENHDLYVEDFIQLSLPVEYPSKINLSNSYLKNDVILCGEFEDQFFEVIYDKKINGFALDPKKGTELLYEFYKIQDKVGKKIK